MSTDERAAQSTATTDVRRHARGVGVVSAVVIVVVALVVVALLDPGVVSGPLATFVLSYLPVQIVLAGMWAHDPARLPGRSRLVRGGILFLVAVVVGVVAELVFVATVGGGQGTSTPQIAMFSIVTVVSAFWLGVVFEGWPFRHIPNRVAGTVAMVLAVYAVALVIYYVLFDLSFLPPAAQFPASPTGLVNGWSALAFIVTAISGMFLPPAFGFLGLDRLEQPVRGLAWTVVLLVWAGVLFGIGVGAIGADPVDFLVWVPVPLLFGGLIILVVLRDSLFGGLARPARGVANVLGMAALGVLLVWVYSLVVRGLVSPSVPWGPPKYQAEVWIASATLAFTFPLLATHADFFEFWPLPSHGPVPVGTEAEELPGI